jgi:ABC-type thiamine transport system ATPase subunit
VVQRFPISQDQRNTVAAQVHLEPHPRLWFMSGIRYGSGLPVELQDEDNTGGDLPPLQPISPAILEQVNFERGRIQPNFSLDLGMGLKLWERDRQFVLMQVGVRNATDRLNVINFNGLFSGTALAPGRQITFQIKTRF